MCGFGDKVCPLTASTLLHLRTSLSVLLSGSASSSSGDCGKISNKKRRSNTCERRVSQTELYRLPSSCTCGYSDIDCSFFVVTADLWSPDGLLDRNLVLHPASSDRYSTAHAPKKRRPNHPVTPYPVEEASSQAGAPTSRYPVRLPAEDQVCVMRWHVPCSCPDTSV